MVAHEDRHLGALCGEVAKSVDELVDEIGRMSVTPVGQVAKDVYMLVTVMLEQPGKLVKQHPAIGVSVVGGEVRVSGQNHLVRSSWQPLPATRHRGGGVPPLPPPTYCNATCPRP